jgi:spectinomycin phosphotransferase
VRSRPEHVGDSIIRAAVAEGWRTTIKRLRYVAVGGGAYHWVARTADGRRWFVTCDDLDIKPWLGDGRDAVFEGLLTAYGAAIELRDTGAAFVVAPVPATSGAAAVRVDDRHAVSVFDFVDGESGVWGRPLRPGADGELIEMLASLHRTIVAAPLPVRGLDVPGRDELTAALAELDQRWDGGPRSEPARHLLADHAEVVVGWLDDLDRVAPRLASDPSTSVVTHGEPHPGNLVRTSAGMALLDWDTVALARPERDLWMITDREPALLDRYQSLTGITVEPDALAAFRRLWALADLAAFSAQLRRPHRRGADTDRALAALDDILAGREPAPHGTPPPAR